MVFGTVADVTLVSSVYASVFNKDIATGRDLGLTTFERGMRMGTVFGGAVAKATTKPFAKAIQDKTRAVVGRAKSWWNTPRKCKAATACFVSGTQVVNGREVLEIQAPGEETESRSFGFSNLLFAGLALGFASTSVVVFKKQKRRTRRIMDRFKNISVPENEPKPSTDSALSETNHEPGKVSLMKPFLASLFFVLAILCGYFALQTSTTVAVSPSQTRIVERYSTKNIEDIEVGQVIPAFNPEGSETDRLNLERPNPETWRKLTLITPKSNDTISEVTLLRPLWWLEEQKAETGGEIWVEVPECGISNWAKLLAIEDCPSIEEKDGEVVTGTFKHCVSKILDIRIEGESKTIGSTPNHPFWSEDCREFIRADELRIGSRLRKIDGSVAKVLDVQVRDEAEHFVYNIEVHSQHTYFVGNGGLLVHNARQDPRCDYGNSRLRDPATGQFLPDPNSTPPQKPTKHGNSKDTDVPATLYTKHDEDGDFLKWGISQDPESRYTPKELDGGDVRPRDTGPRNEMLEKERWMTERFPGPENHEPWAGKMDPSHPNYDPSYLGIR